MEIFNEDITWLRRYIESKRAQGRQVRLLDSGRRGERHADFLKREKATVVLSEDTWLELGSPNTSSTAPVLVTDCLALVNDGAITLIGPDIPEARGSLSFAQVLMIASTELRDEDYRKINSLQYGLELQGYMIKAIPSSLTIWSRVSEETAGRGFSFEIMGRAIIDRYRSSYDIPSIEILFVTSSREDVEELEYLHQKVTRILKAMNKMIDEMAFDCSACEYLDVCGDVRQLGALRDKMMKQRQMGEV